MPNRIQSSCLHLRNPGMKFQRESSHGDTWLKVHWPLDGHKRVVACPGEAAVPPTGLHTVCASKVWGICHSNMWKMASYFFLIMHGAENLFSTYSHLPAFRYLWTVSICWFLTGLLIFYLLISWSLYKVERVSLCNVSCNLPRSLLFVYFYVVKLTNHLLSNSGSWAQIRKAFFRLRL